MTIRPSVYTPISLIYIAVYTVFFFACVEENKNCWLMYKGARGSEINSYRGGSSLEAPGDTARPRDYKSCR